MPNKIKNKFTFPKATEFTPRDLVIDVKSGHLYYKSNYAVFRVNATVFSTNVDSSLSTDATIGIAQDTEVLFNNSTTIDGIGNFTVTAATDGSGNGTVNIGTVNIDGGAIDGTVIGGNSVAAGTFAALQASSTFSTDLTSNKIVYAGASGQLKTDSNLSFNPTTNILEVTKIGAFQSTGAINFDNQNMTNVDINSGTMDSVFINGCKIGTTGAEIGNFTRIILEDAVNTKQVTSESGENLFIVAGNPSGGYNSPTSGGGIRLVNYNSSAAPMIIMKGAVLVNNMDNSPGSVKAVNDIVAYASDKRLKENIVNIENPLQKIKQLRGVYFDWKDKTKKLGFIPTIKKNEIGMIAQEVEKIIPQAIETAPFDELYEGTDREKYKTIKYDKIIPLLVECINEQQKQIDNLTNQIKQWQK